MKPAPILGIDFGTTNTAAAFFDADNKLRLVPVTDKSFILPSVVWYHAADKAIVGHAARTQIIDDPRHTLFGAKRFLGRRYQSEYVARHKDRFAFELIEGADGYTAARVYGRTVPLAEVAQHVIRQILTLANHAAGTRFTECVLTVPAHAGVRQREATRQAAEQAGLTVRALVNEPTAAALYYANLRSPERTVLVFDLGGGTFDATLLSIRNRVVQVLATGGDAFLGGANFDEAIVESLLEEFQRQHGIDLRSNKVVMQRLVFAAEATKIALSTKDTAALRVPCIAQKDGQFIDFDFQLTRQRLEEIVFKLVERAASACDELLERVQMEPRQIDELVLVGGQVRMPAIRRRLERFPHLSSDKDVHPDLAVAIGAAVLGRDLRRGTPGLADVVPMPISVMLPGGRTHEVIPANTSIPCARRVSLGELPRWTAPIPLAVLESLDRTSVERELLGTVAVPPDWRAAQSEPPSLELRMGQDFALTARLVSAAGEALPANIVAPPRPAPTAS